MTSTTTETHYQVSHPEGTLYTPSLTVAMARAKCSQRAHPKTRVTVTEIVETRWALPVEPLPAKAKSTKAPRKVKPSAKSAKEA